MNPYFNNQYPQQGGWNQSQQPDLSQAKPVTPVPVVELPPDDVVTGGFKFTVLKENESDRAALTVDHGVDLGTTKKRGRKKSNPPATVDPTTIVKAEPDVVDSTAYTYQETTEILRGTLAQIDELSYQIRGELDAVRGNRTIKNRYGIITNLSENLSALLNTKISAIREINSSITKSNDLDYKKQKDFRDANGKENDDKYLMDMYNAFIQNPMGVTYQPGTSPLGPTAIDATLGNNIIRADMSTGSSMPDAGYLNYISAMTPEQNLMRYEGNPNVKQVVVYDAATGNKFFQIMDMSTMQVIPNVPVRSQMFMEDTTIDLNNRIAKNVNLNDTYPVVVLNDGVTAEY